MSELKITKFGFIHKDKETGNIILSDFELEGGVSGNTHLAVIDAIIEEFQVSRAEYIKEQEQIKK